MTVSSLAITNLSEEVERARSGDADAFASLVTRFQDAAVATAYGWLGDIEEARDAAQDAFFEASRNLHQLREAGAFWAWFRRVLLKACDRRTRRRELLRASLGGDLEWADRAPGPEVLVEEAERHAAVRRAVEALPVGERLVVSLFYLAGYDVKAIAAYAGLTDSAVKKRLHAARGRLKGGVFQMAQESIGAMRPSRDGRFTAEMRLFEAVRTKDVPQAARVLDEHPELVNSVESWSDDDARELEIGHAREGTPLIRAAERGDLSMVEMLLARGAEVNKACGCSGGESPLWAATVSGTGDVVRSLLRHGADPDAVAFRGTTALHAAVIRGDARIVDALRAAGAREDIRDQGGRLARDWESLKRGEATNADDVYLQTGIKALELFAPVRRGDGLCVVSEPGLGQMVLVAELTRNLLAALGGQSYWLGFPSGVLDQHGVEHVLDEAHLRERASVRIAARGASSPEQSEAFFEAVQWVRRQPGPKVAVLVEAAGHVGDVLAALPELSGDGGCLLTIVLRGDEGEAAVSRHLEDFAAEVWLARALARRGLFPAVDPVRTRSRYIRQTGSEVIARARDVLGSYLVADPGLERWGNGATSDVERAQQLLAFMTQPFSTTEAFSGRSGEFVTYEEAIAGCSTILEGPPTGRPLDELLYRGAHVRRHEPAGN